MEFSRRPAGGLVRPHQPARTPWLWVQNTRALLTTTGGKRLIQEVQADLGLSDWEMVPQRHRSGPLVCSWAAAQQGRDPTSTTIGRTSAWSQKPPPAANGNTCTRRVCFGKKDVREQRPLAWKGAFAPPTEKTGELRICTKMMPQFVWLKSTVIFLCLILPVYI